MVKADTINKKLFPKMIWKVTIPVVCLSLMIYCKKNELHSSGVTKLLRSRCVRAPGNQTFSGVALVGGEPERRSKV